MKNEIKLTTSLHGEALETSPTIVTESLVNEGDHGMDGVDAYPVTNNPNIIPPTEFMAIGMYERY